SPLMSAIADTAVGKWMGDTGLQFYGWVDVGANISSSTTKPGGNAPAAYMYTPNTFQLDQFVIYIDRFPDTVQSDHIDWGMRLSGLYGENYRYTTAYGTYSWQLLNRNRVNGYDYPMLYGELFIPKVYEGLMLRLGRFISLPDIEAQLAPNNYMYSHSMTYAFDNYTNTGLQSTLAITKQFFVQLGVTVGTEASFMHWHSQVYNPNGNALFGQGWIKQDPGAMPSYTGCIRWNSKDGNDDLNVCADAINRGTWGYNNLQWFGFTAYHKWNDQWHISWETYHEYEKGVPNLNSPYVQNLNNLYGTDGGTPFSAAQGILFNNPNEAYCSKSTQLTCTAGSYGVVTYINYSPDPLNNFSIRPEFYDDPQGQRTGVPTRYGNFALGWQHWWSPQVEVRPEIAFYHSFNAPAFNGNSNAGIAPDKPNATIVSGDLIWHF
ncbi:MAG TPA: outer membrane beta-barrel protein, partial [Burkholderiaceae bacterium]|nr:outer membrane beta-barrel protein [Burkholderiaceae bacterium]